MSFLYFDDSRHQNAGFDLGAFVYCKNDPSHEVAGLLRESGLVPFKDEYKSGRSIRRYPEYRSIRAGLFSFLREARIAVVVTPTAHPYVLGQEALILLQKVLAHPLVRGGDKPSVYFDEGLFPSRKAAEQLAARSELDQLCQIEFEQDSVACPGIQLADLVAHTCSMMLVEQLGHKQKVLMAGPESGYPLGTEVTLGYEMWARLRSQFLGLLEVRDEHEDYTELALDVSSHGLHITRACSNKLRIAAEERFTEAYIGCIH